MKKLSIRKTLSLASLLMLAPAAFAQTSLADEGLHFGARLGVEHDSNVLRAPSGAVSDTAWTAGVGVRYNKQFSLQRIHADVEWDTWRYSDNSFLNFNTLNYNLGWDWSITPRFHGTLSADRRQYREVTTLATPVTTPTPGFTYANVIGRRTERNELAEGGFGVAGPWRVLAGVSHYRTESTNPGSWDASPDITYWQAGVGYEAASGSSLALRYKHGKGDYKDTSLLGPALAGRDFTDKQVELAFRWAATGKTSIDGRVAHVSRDHDAGPALDFSGMTAAVNVNWDITGKTRLAAGYMRDLSATGLSSGGKVTSDRFFIAPVWHATAKTAFNVRYDHTHRKWDDLPGATAFTGRGDTIQALQAGVDWDALRTITVSGYIRNERLSSSVPNAGYHANVYGVVAKANF